MTSFRLSSLPLASERVIKTLASRLHSKRAGTLRLYVRTNSKMSSLAQVEPLTGIDLWALHQAQTSSGSSLSLSNLLLFVVCSRWVDITSTHRGASKLMSCSPQLNVKGLIGSCGLLEMRSPRSSRRACFLLRQGRGCCCHHEPHGAWQASAQRVDLRTTTPSDYTRSRHSPSPPSPLSFPLCSPHPPSDKGPLPTSKRQIRSCPH